MMTNKNGIVWACGECGKILKSDVCSCKKEVKMKYKEDQVFSILNCDDAKSLIGKKVLFCDNEDYHDNKWYGPYNLFEIDKDGAYAFNSRRGSFHLIKTCPETFEDEKKDKLKKALKLSWLQWEMMAVTGERKHNCYNSLGGSVKRSGCFLCDSFNLDYCKGCIKWDGTDVRHRCEKRTSPYFEWKNNQTKENAQKVADFLRSELDKLEG